MHSGCMAHCIACRRMRINSILSIMATQLNKTKSTKNGGLKACNVTRELATTDAKGNRLIVTLEMGDYITFRSKGKRRSYSMSLANVYYITIMASIDKQYHERLTKWEKDKKMGLKRRKPKKPRLVGVSADVLHALTMKANKD